MIYTTFELNELVKKENIPDKKTKKSQTNK